MAWNRFVRFEDRNGHIHYGDLDKEVAVGEIVGSKVTVLSGDPFQGFIRTEELREVVKLLCPLESTPIFQCVGINYRKHANETNFRVPSLPVIFTKPADSIAGPLDNIYVHHDARPELDYEGELCFIIKRDCKDVFESEALDYVLGYTVGNDLSARNYIPEEVSGFQMSYGKSFDAFAPIGPFVASPAVVGDPHKLQLVTKVNGEVRQNANTEDMIWNVRQIIVHMSKGRTLRAGTVVMTGTPSGVGWFMKPQRFVVEGDRMEVYIEKLGSIRNVIQY